MDTREDALKSEKGSLQQPGRAERVSSVFGLSRVVRSVLERICLSLRPFRPLLLSCGNWTDVAEGDDGQDDQDLRSATFGSSAAASDAAKLRVTAEQVPGQVFQL